MTSQSYVWPVSSALWHVLAIVKLPDTMTNSLT